MWGSKKGEKGAPLALSSSLLFLPLSLFLSLSLSLACPSPLSPPSPLLPPFEGMFVLWLPKKKGQGRKGRRESGKHFAFFPRYYE